MDYAIILAGGTGTRFWPVSSELRPKQFLDLCSSKPMIEDSLRKIKKLIIPENIYIATNRIHAKRIRRCARSLNIRWNNVFLEPQGKNTFAPIGVLAAKIYAQDPNAIIVVLPCDHFIKYEKKFLRLLETGLKAAKMGRIVTFGIPPSMPETGYGYIRVKSKIPAWPAGRKYQISNIYKVQKFIEKPNLNKAKKFLKDKRYYWNSGIFVFRADVILHEIKRILPDAYRLMAKMKNGQDISQLWPKLPYISIDYAVMEKTRKLALIPAHCGWLDLGSWQSIQEILLKDKAGNVFRGNCVDLGSKNSLVWSDNRLVATLGLDNLVVVNTKDALLVCSKERAQDVKKLVQILKQKGKQ